MQYLAFNYKSLCHVCKHLHGHKEVRDEVSTLTERHGAANVANVGA